MGVHFKRDVAKGNTGGEGTFKFNSYCQSWAPRPVVLVYCESINLSGGGLGSPQDSQGLKYVLVGDVRGNRVHPAKGVLRGRVTINHPAPDGPNPHTGHRLWGLG